MTATTRRYVSPLRYPGGKARMASALAHIFDDQVSALDIEIWVEPFAGGAGAGLSLLSTGRIPELWLTERNPAIAALWRAILNQGDQLAALVATTTPTMKLWEQSQEIVAAANAGERLEDLDLGFAAFIVNRCSRSGIIAPRVGPMGGKDQTGKYTIASRFNPPALAERIAHIHSLAPNIRFHEGDAIAWINELSDSGMEDEVFLFVDPPYVREGNRLYTNGMTELDHRKLANALNTSPCHWLLTYDNEDVVANSLYPDRRVLAYEISNTTNVARMAWEYAVLSDNLAGGDTPELLPAGNIEWVRQDVPHLVAA